MIDYTQLKKNYLPVKLIDGNTLLLGVPKKSLYSKLTAIKSNMEENADFDSLYDELLNLCAEILSNNKTQRQFTASSVDAIMDIEDMALLINEYAKFAGVIVANPN